MEDKIFNCVIIAYKSKTDISNNTASMEMLVHPFICRGYDAEETKARLSAGLSKVDPNKTELDKIEIQVTEVDKEQLHQLLNNQIQIVPLPNEFSFDDSIFDEDLLT